MKRALVILLLVMIFTVNSRAEELKKWHTKSGYTIIKVLSGRSNVFLLTDGAKNILIDTGSKAKYKSLTGRLDKLNVKSLDYIILTHAHYDHAANAMILKEDYWGRVIINKADALYLEIGDSRENEGTNRFSKITANLFNGPLKNFLKYRPCKADILTEERYDLNSAGFNAYILHTPGHTPGSSCVIVDGEIAVAGDTVYGNFQNTAMPPFAQDKSILLLSWKKLLNTGCGIFLPSHGSEVSAKRLQKSYVLELKKITESLVKDTFNK